MSCDLYGVTRSLLVQLQSFGVETHVVNVLDLTQVEDAISSHGARVQYFESISNPLLRVSDVAALVEIGHRHRTVVMGDNTFATPYLLRPPVQGVDIVIHSATKYIAGHGDVVAGLVSGGRSIARRIREARTLQGGILSPFGAWLTLRGLRTLALRIDRPAECSIEKVADTGGSRT